MKMIKLFYKRIIQFNTRRAKGSKQRYYTWDHTHNDIEVFDSNKKHLGSIDPVNGLFYKGPVKGRKL